MLSKETLEASIRAHRMRPRSLAMKTPLLFERLFGVSGYDLLVDDSDTTAKYFQAAGLMDCLLHIEGGYPNTGYGFEIIDAIKEKLENPKNNLTRLKYSGKHDDLIENIPLIRIEDPLYYPLLHKSDQLPVT